jgi:hypothetical protein
MDGGGNNSTVLENNVAKLLLILIMIFHLLNQAFNILIASSSFVSANYMLPDRTVTLVSSASIEIIMLPDFLRSSGSGTGSTQPREYN